MEGQREPPGFQPITEFLTALHDLPVAYRHALDRGCSTGWRCVDQLLQGIRPGEMTVVTADTGVGKTTFCTQLMVNCAMQGVTPWVSSWEMRNETMMRKFASIILKKPMKMCPFTDPEWQEFIAWSKAHPIIVNRSTIGTTMDVLAKQLFAAKLAGVKVVMLDHLDYLVNFRREKMHEAIDDTVKRLHELAFSLEMHFFLICHPRQSSNSNEEVGMHALKGSSSIKQYADNIIILHRCGG